MGDRSTYAYLRDPDAIYERSFAIVREEADLSRLPENLHAVAVRLIHACGMTDLPLDLAWGGDPVTAGQAALQAGAPILADVEMVRHGIIDSSLPARNAVICTLNDDDVAAAAKTRGETRSALAVERWREHLAGAVVCIGNAPTALFYLLEMLEKGAPRPAAIIGMPVGFVGAAESKDALEESGLGIPYALVKGRMGGSAMTAAAINAVARAGL